MKKKLLIILTQAIVLNSPGIFNGNLLAAFASQDQQAVHVKPEEIIIAEGQGTSLNSAKLDAFRNAISEVVGTYIKSDTVVENYVTKSDRVKSKIEGFIKSSKLKSQRKSSDGIVTVNFEIIVSTKPIREDVKSVVGVEFEAVGHPTVCVVGWTKSNERVEQELNVTAVTALNRALIKRGYKVVDQWEIEKLRNEDKEISKKSRAVDRDEFDSLALDIANQLKADIYVTTFGSFQDNKTSVCTKMFNSYTGQVFGDETGYGTVTGESVSDIKESVDQAISGSIEKILPMMSEHWQGVLTNGQEYIIVFENIDGKQRLKAKDILKKGDFDEVTINSVKQVNAVPGHVEFSIYASGDPVELFDQVLEKLNGEDIKIFKEQYVMRGGRALFIIEKK